MIKKVSILFALVIISQVMAGQTTINDLFNEFSNSKSADKVKIGKITMSLAGIFSDTMGVDGIEVLSFSESDMATKQNFAEAVKKVKDKNFETMINTSENGERTKVMLRIQDDIIHELVILTSGDAAAMVRIKGKIRKSDIQKLVNEHS